MLKYYLWPYFLIYDVSKTIDEINYSNKLRKFLKIKEIPNEAQFYEYISRYSALQFNNIVNSFLSRLNKKNRARINRYIVDATLVACDINIIKKYISPEKLEKLKLKMGYSTTKCYYIGFKVTMVLYEKILCPVSMLIHSGTPKDSKLFEPTLKELKRRWIIKNKDIILFDKGYCSYKNYEMGVNEYNIVPVIFPRYNFKIERLNGWLSYPINVFDKKVMYTKIKNFLKKLKIVY